MPAGAFEGRLKLTKCLIPVLDKNVGLMVLCREWSFMQRVIGHREEDARRVVINQTDAIDLAMILLAEATVTGGL